MKKGINQWAFPSNLSLDQIFKLASDAGFDGIELNLEKSTSHQNEKDICTLSLDTNKEDIAKIGKLVNQYGLEIHSLSTALLWDYSLTGDDKNEREMAKRIVQKMIDVASWLEADTILVVPGAVDVPWKPQFQPIPYDKAYERSLAALKELKQYAEEKQITIAVENVWNKFLLSPLEMRDFIDEIDSDYVGIYFDVGNILLTGYPEHWIEILGSRIKRIHLKDFRKMVNGQGIMVNLLEGDVNWKNVVSALQKIGYKSYLTAELFPYKFHYHRLIHETAQAIETIIKN